jgi:membrane-bound ClpP family serine protease
MGVNKMSALRKRAIVISLALLVMAAAGQSATAAVPRFTKSVTPMEGGVFMVKIRMTASGNEVYALRLIDPEAAMVDVFAPRGWVTVTDGEEFLARSGDPLKDGKTVEFVIYSKSDKIAYTWTAFGKIKQIGKPGAF